MAGHRLLGRDRCARLLRGTRVDALAPAAAAVSALLAFAMGGSPGFFGGFSERAAKSHRLVSFHPLVLSVADGPGDASVEHLARSLGNHHLPHAGDSGMGGPCQDHAGASASLRQSDFIVMARSLGVSPPVQIAQHVLPNLRPILLAQFWISVPVFVLAEANLSLLGLGVAEPLPSLGSLLRELETVMSFRADLCRFSALVMLVLIVSGMQIAVIRREVS